MISLIIFLIIIIGILGYISYNLLTKVEKLEQMIDNQDQYIQRFSNAVGVTNQRLEDIDEKGSFKSDDEIGWFFESLKTLQSELNDFNIDGNRK
jgi:hypothetical protein